MRVVADLVAIGLGHDTVGGTMLVDVGTSRIVAASCPAGPAFDAGEVTYGMQASAGAIESVRACEDGSLNCATIDGAAPLGLRGFGLIDLVAELRRTGRLTPKDVFAERAASVPVAEAAGSIFACADASALAQAKAANTLGQAILLRELGIHPGDVDRPCLAGGFATDVDIENAVEIGFLDPVPAERVVKMGNASQQGARELLLSAGAREAAKRLVSRIEHVELETTPEFFELFVDGCQFKPLASSPGRVGGGAGI